MVGINRFGRCDKAIISAIILLVSTALVSSEDCWWTGCQPSSWAVTGCDQYNRTEKARETCEDGSKYQCCEPEEVQDDRDCWWTGCQPNSWAVTGCDQYNRTEKVRKTCEDGFKYQCCEQFLTDQCWWSECQSEDWEDRGCPSNTVQNRTQSCEDGGDLFQCCLKKSAADEDADQDDVEEVSGGSFTDFVKYLLLKSTNYTIRPDKLRCDLIDVNRSHIFQIGDDGIRVCDLCPNFPQQRYQNMYLDRNVTDVRDNFDFSDCFGLCFETDYCTAFSYDHEHRECRIYNSTDGYFEEKDRWTTVFMTQPTGVLFDWVYSRHTLSAGPEPTSRQSTDTFLTCLEKCDAMADGDCNAVSYSLLNSTCTTFRDVENDLERVDFEYGHLSAYRMAAVQSASGDQLWRFAEIGDADDVLSLKPNTTKTDDDQQCNQAQNSSDAYGSFYSKACLTTPMVGCDSETGCKTCYYPEKSNGSDNLSICPDSNLYFVNGMKKILDEEIRGCLENADCMGVGVDSGQVEPITLADFGGREYDLWYALKFPEQTTAGVQKHLKNYDFIANLAVRPLSNASSAVQTFRNVTFDQCVSDFQKNADRKRMSYYRSEETCVLSSEFVKLTKTEDALTLFKKPSYQSPHLNYVRSSGVRVLVQGSGSRGKLQVNCKANCEEKCAQTCNQPANDWCRYVSVDYIGDNSAKCYFFEASNDTYLGLEASNNSVVLVAQSKSNFTLASLNQVSPFSGDANIVLECFSGTDGQTQTSLTVYGAESNGTTAVATRRRRGLLSWIKKAAKSVAETVVNGVKDTVNEVVDTAKGVVKAADKAVHGDWEGAKHAALNIPIVKDVKNVVEFGGAVVTGDWDSAKKKAADAGSSLLNVGLTFVPGAGKLVGNIGKSAVKGLKPALKSGNKAPKKIKPKQNDSKSGKKNEKEDKKKDDDFDEKTCEYRTKRAASKGNTNKKCDPNKCDAPTNVARSFGDSFESCSNKKVGSDCSYECKVGYEEKGPDLTCSGGPKKKATWSPQPACSLYLCESGQYPVVPVMTPKVKGLSSIATSNYIVVYAVLFDKSRKLPVWSAALHQSDQLNSKSYNEVQDFDRLKIGFYKYPCAAVKKSQASDRDYNKSGYDRGHLTPVNIARWSRKSVKSTFAFINIAPQVPHINEHPWKDVEFHVECFSSKRRALVVTGLCKDSLKEKIGTQNIEVPKCFWKMVCYLDEKLDEQVVGFVADNSPIKDGTKDDREEAIFTPVSQEDILRLYDSSLANPWLKLSKLSMSRQHGVQSSGNPGTVFMPINPYSCMEAKKLPEAEKEAWENKLKKTDSDSNSSQNNKKQKTRKRRAANAGLQRGCTSSELREKREFYNLYSKTPAVYSDDDSDEDDAGQDDSGGEQVTGDVEVSVQNCGKRVVGYYTSWGKKKINGKMLAKVTHVIYAFLEIREDGTVDLGSPDKAHSSDIDEETRVARQRLQHLMSLSKFYPHVKVTFAVGGWENSQYFSGIAASSGSRIKFIASIVKIIEKYGFDGVDIDWEYPVTGGAVEGVPQDKSNYVLLMKELRQALDTFQEEAGRKNPFLISFAGAAGQWTLDPGFDLPGLLKYADYVNVMTYDYFGAWGSKWGAYTGSPAPLFFGMPPRFSGKTNVDWTIKYYTCKTKLPHKINMGVPFYGRFWKNVGDPVDGKDGMWRTAQSVNGVFEGGSTPWFKLQEDHLSDSRFEKVFHNKSKTPYAWNAATKVFLGYEDQKSLEFKVKYATDKNVGGVMIWSLDLDDEDLTLLNSVYKAPLCDKTDPKGINHKCSPIDEKRWWTSEDGDDVAGLCGRSAPLYKGYYPVCDPDDPGYSCCGPSGYCGSGEKYCDCPTCKDYGNNPSLILDAPIRPTVPVTWYYLNAKEGLRGRCGRKIDKINGVYPTCNPDDDNAYCCSNGNYCGKNSDFCDCQGCVNFKKTPTYRYGPKKWWTQEDGDKRAGTCGPKADKVDGKYEAECEPNTNFSCCSPSGYCGSGPDYCDCKGCKRF